METIIKKIDFTAISKSLKKLITELKKSNKTEAADYFAELAADLQKQSRKQQKLMLSYLSESAQLFQFVNFSDKENKIFDEILHQATAVLADI